MKLSEELERSFIRWDNLNQYGGSDPFWEDGCNMNLVRNHIINYKQEIKKQNKTSEICQRETPPKVDNKYMARAEEIRINANRSLKIYKGNRDFEYLTEVSSQLNKYQANETCILNVINYVKGLEKFIEIDSLIDMRRHESSKSYIESFERCRRNVENLIGSRPKIIFYENSNQLQGQMSIMDFIGG